VGAGEVDAAEAGGEDQALFAAQGDHGRFEGGR